MSIDSCDGLPGLAQIRRGPAAFALSWTLLTPPPVSGCLEEMLRP
jgi:hypothetical protein